MSSTLRDASILKAVAGVIREQVGKAFDALSAKVDGLSEGFSREIAEIRKDVAVRPEKGEPGASVTAEDVLPELKGIVAEYLDALPVPKDGTSVGLDDVLPHLERAVESISARWERDFERHANGVMQRAIERIPEPKSGRDGRDGSDGRDSDPDDVAARVIERLDLKGTRTDMKRLCAELVSAEVEKMPRPKDGVDGAPGRDGKDGADGLHGKDGVEGIHGKDGRDGVDGKDGAAGKDGKSVTPEEIKQLVDARTAEWQLDFEKRAQDTLQKAVDRLPRPKDGADGFSLEHMDIATPDGGRTWLLSFDNGDRRIERTIVTATLLYREVWKKGITYLPGDMVTWGGSGWVCMKETTSQPNGYSPDWKLAVKRGKNGVSPEK